ncbi:uncharacterized protein EV154DRAFT_529417 [Mucor mucedo]|uniref:uncharacterized protein n=1 Tax=Mucor mucedo TaxID=29922 RepID=UPI0022201492|nr:uncharacterized protein EV154DRAFT_529417 [Mucor mucedo]KAI7871988.1 hypothetical protein EV154DRAFT_529417 [Mucor mucedo]
MKPSLTATFLILAAANNALAQVVQARHDSSCAFLSKKIYCYGGLTDADGTISDVSIVMLDVFNSSGSTADEMMNRWVTVTTNTNGVDLKARDFPQIMQMPDDKTLLISGGWNNAYTKLTSQTITYNSETNSWKNYANYTEAPYGNRQICQASSVYVPNLGVGFYGGIETNFENTWTYPGINVTAYEEDNLRYIGYTNLTFLNIENTSNPWSTYPVQTNIPTLFYMYQTSVFDAKSNRIFFFGGGYSNPTTYYYEDSSFASSVTFDLTKGAWGTQAMSGDSPSPRSGHTTNLVGPNQRDVLLYGGESLLNNDRALLDYCFVLNLDTFQWKQQNFVGSNAALIRTQHSAVAINNETLFIVFGKDTANVPTLSVLMLDVTNPSNITLMEKYVDPTAVVVPPVANSTTTPIPENESKLSTGATAGIAVGASAAGILAIAAIVFCVLRKRKNEKKQQEINESEISKKENFEEPVMEVNWDEIDKKYVEVATSPIADYGHGNHFSYSPRLADDLASFNDGSTVIQSVGSPVIQSVGSPVTNRNSITHQRPNALDDNDRTSNIGSYTMALQKPDGA